MKKLTLALAGFISILFTTSTIAQVPTDQARNFQADATHTGAVTTPGLIPPLKQRWAVNFGQPISYPLIADGRVFVTVKDPAGNGTNLFALDATNGAIIWSAPLGGFSWWSGACYENGRVFALNGSGLLRAFDAVTGTLIWTATLPSSIWNAPPTAFQGVIYASGALRVFALNANTGATIWTKSVVNGDTSSPAVTSDGLWVSYACPNVYKLNPATGEQIWFYSPGCSGGGGKTPALYQGRLYVRDSQDTIFNAQDGTIIGSFNAKNTPAFLDTSGFFLNGPHGFGSFGTLQARDINTNSLRWNFAGDGQLQSAVLVVNGYVYVGSASGKLYAVNAAFGQQAWVTTAGTSIPYVDEHNVSQPTTGFAAAEGLLVVPTSTTLVAYDEDHTPPTVTFGDPTPAMNAAGWNNTPADVPFTIAGVGSADPASPLHFTSEGANQTQDVTLTDRDGNLTTVTSRAINMDMTAPTTSANITGSGGVWSTSVQVALSSTDNLSGVANTFYRIDGGAVQTYTSEFSVSSNGTHTLSYWSVDVAGNTESARSSVVKVDSAAPTTQFIPTGTTGTNGWFRSAVQIFLSAFDNNQSGVASTFYSVDGGTTQTFAGNISINAEGVHQVNFWSVDNLGNTEAQQSATVKIDSTAPTVLHSLSGVLSNLGYYTSPVQITLNASDNLSGVANVYYRIDGGNTNNYTGTFTYSIDGTHQVDYWDVDVAGNNSLNVSTVIFRIDKTPPVTQVSFSENNLGNHGWYRGTVQISISATDNLSGVQNTQYMIDNGTAKIYSAPFNYSTNGIHTFTYWSIDKVLNSETVRTVQLKIDQQSPSVSMSATPASVAASSTPVTVTVSGRITDAISGIDPASVFFNVIDEYSVVNPTGPVTLQPNGDFSFTLSLPATKNVGDRQHVYTITVSAGDMAGISKSVTDTVKIN
jgi:outer membrane protein assembly factor BamB